MLGAGKLFGTDLSKTVVVTEGFSAPIYGFGPSIGSVSPTQYRGSSFRSLLYNTTSTRLIVQISGNHAQSFFYSVQFQDGAEVLSSAATYQYVGAGNYTEWYWTQSKPSRWDGSGSSTVIFKPYNLG